MANFGLDKSGVVLISHGQEKKKCAKKTEQRRSHICLNFNLTTNVTFRVEC